ncbi:MAG: ATP-binding protein [Elainellaceae cyanobacterium]
MPLKFLRRDTPRSSSKSHPSHLLLPLAARRKKLSLQRVLVIPFLVQISAAVGLTGYISLRNGQEAVSTLAEDLIKQTKLLVNRHLDDYLSTPHQINQVNANLLQQGVFSPRDFDALSQHFWAQAQTYSDVSYIGFGLPNGEYVGAGDWYDTPGIEIDRTFADSTHYTYSVNDNGRPKAIIDRSTYYPAQEEWFTKTVAAGKARWVLSFEDVAETVYVAATANRPLYNADGSLLGVLGVDLQIADVSAFLNQLKPTELSSIFILEQDGTLIAASDSAAGNIAVTPSNLDRESDERESDNPGSDNPGSDNQDTSKDVTPEPANRAETDAITGAIEDEPAAETANLSDLASQEQPLPLDEGIRLNRSEPELPNLENGEAQSQGLNPDKAPDSPSASSSEPSPADLRSAQRPSIFDSQDPKVRAMATALYDTDGKRMLNVDQVLSINIDGDRHYLQVTPWQDEFGLNWRVVVMVPESEFMAQIQHNTRNTLGLCLLALAVASLLGVFTSRWIARPILQINQAAGAIATGQLDQQVPSSNIGELASLAASFNHMAAQVKLSLSQYAQDNETLEARVRERTQELTQALQELQQTQGQLVHNEKMSSLGVLVAGIAHELNNPINFIYGNLPYASVYVEQLLDLLNHYQREYPTPSEEIQNLTEEIEFSFLQSDLPRLLNSLNVGASRIQDIIRSLRSFSRVDESTLKTVNIHEGIDSTLMILNSRIKAQPNRGEIEIIRGYGDIPDIACSPGPLNQVLMNILSNAVDAIESAIEKKPDLNPKISIRTYLDRARRTSGLLVRSAPQSQRSARLSPETYQPANDSDSSILGDRPSPSERVSKAQSHWHENPENQSNCVTIAIADNGLGIPEAIRQQIFDPFFTTKPIGKGTGLGLSISYKIIAEKHRGMLTCRSTPGHGTEFQITLPLRLDSDRDL